MSDHKIPDQQILDLIHDQDWHAVKRALADRHPADIADIVDRCPLDLVEHVFSLVPEETKPDALAELESVSGAELLESLTDSELSAIVEEMAPDDAADVLGELPEGRSEQVLELMEDEESAEVRKLLEYEDDTAGGIMTSDVVAMQRDQTVEEALEAIAYMEADDPFFNAYIIDENGRLTGHVDIWDLLRERRKSRPLGELVCPDINTVTVDTDQEDVAQLMNKYDVNALPVVDLEGRLVGRVTADDVIDVMEEEASEDIFRLAGSDDAELEIDSAFRSCLVRLPWLIVTLLGGFLTSLILRQFLGRISDILVLAAFVPIVLAMGGNTGIQSSTLVVRSIALGGLQGKSVMRLLRKEICIGALMGTVCALIIGAWVHLVGAVTRGSSPGLAPVHLALIVGLSLFSAMTFAAIFGATVPLALNRLRVDPAVASGPFITIANDISALLIYFGITVLLVNALA